MRNPAADEGSLGAEALRARACRWLARRDRSRAEAHAYLARLCAEPQIVEQVLDELAARGWLSETRLAEQVLRVRRARGSAQRVRHEMARRGIDREVIAQTTAGLEQGDLDAAAKLLGRRFGTPATDRAERERRLRFLVNRGFARAVALKALRAAGDPDVAETAE